MLHVEQTKLLLSMTSLSHPPHEKENYIHEQATGSVYKGHIGKAENDTTDEGTIRQVSRGV